MRYIKGREISDGSFLKSNEGFDIFNPTHEDYIKNGWEVFEEPTEYSEDSIETLKQNILFDAENYFKSAVCTWRLNGIKQDWIPVSERGGFYMILQDMISRGEVDWTFIIGGRTVSVTQALSILQDLNIYAGESYSVFLRHLDRIKQLGSKIDLINYDFTSEYLEVPNILL